MCHVNPKPNNDSPHFVCTLGTRSSPASDGRPQSWPRPRSDSCAARRPDGYTPTCCGTFGNCWNDFCRSPGWCRLRRFHFTNGMTSVKNISDKPFVWTIYIHISCHDIEQSAFPRSGGSHNGGQLAGSKSTTYLVQNFFLFC